MVLNFGYACEPFQEQQVLLLLGRPFHQAFLQTCCDLPQAIAASSHLGNCKGTSWSCVYISMSHNAERMWKAIAVEPSQL